MAEPRRPPQRVGWLELFFDLVFVVVIAQLTEHVEARPSLPDILVVAGLLVAVWASWNNTTLLANVGGGIPRALRPLIFVSMAGIGVLAVAIPTISGAGQVVFAIGYAIARIAVWPLWLQQRRRGGYSILRPTLFGPGAAALWLASIAVPDPWRLGVWGVLLLYEVLSLFFGLPSSPVDSGHMSERVGLFVMIVLGESVLELVRRIAERPDAATWLVGGLAFAVVCCLWWRYFELTGALREQIERTSSGAVFRDVLVIAHYVVVLGLLLIGAGLGATISGAGSRTTSPGVILLLATGIALYQLSGAFMSVRFSRAWATAGLALLPTVAAIAVLAGFGSGWPAWLVVTVVLADGLAQIALTTIIQRVRAGRGRAISRSTGSARRS